MPPSLVHFIVTHGYWAIFWLIFLQEIGVPNPVSNELVLLFSGSLGFSGLLSFPLIFITAVGADILGAVVLYVFFRFIGNTIVENNPKWLPVSAQQIERVKKPIRKYGVWGVFFGRLLPFARGYAAVAAGLLGVEWLSFILTVLASALVWSGGFVTLGLIFGKYIVQVEHTTDGILKLLLGAIIITVLIISIRALLAHRKKKRSIQ